MSNLIEKIVLTNFRGASSRCEVRFDTKKPLVMIFGENGTGKSTLIDAIDFVANEEFGSLADRSVGNLRHAYLHTIGKTPSDLRVELTAGGSTRVGTLSGRSANVTGADNGPTVNILRRSRLLRLVEAEPAKRYEELKSFIDVQAVETSEQSLRDAARLGQDDLDKAVAVLDEAITALDVLWKKEGSPGNDAEEWADTKAKADQIALKSRVNELQSVGGFLEEIKKKKKTLEDAISAIGIRQQELKGVNDEIAASPGIQGEQVVQLIELLQKAQTVVALPNDPKSCPVCEQPIVAADLRNTMANRLSAMRQFDLLGKKRNKADRDLHAAETARGSACKAFIKGVRETTSSVRTGNFIPQDVAKVSWQDHDRFLKDGGDGDEQLPAAKVVAEILGTIQSAYQNDLQMAQADLSQHNAIKTQLDRIISNRSRTSSLHGLLDQMKKALQICEETRRSFTQNILDAVAGETDRLYSIIHPNEPLGALRLRLDPNKRASVEQGATFAGHTDVPPQAYFSESHLDTLGFCVWIAVAKRNQPKDTIVVLDDVFTSIDSVHLTRIMQLLTELGNEFAQVIVTTHYRTWRDRYRLNQGPGLSVQLLELHRWSLNRGVCLSGTKLAVDELDALLVTQPLDRQGIASHAGILLEAVLDRLSIQYRRRLPRTRDGDWTLGDLLNGCKKLLGAIQIERTILASGPGNRPAADTPGPHTVVAQVQPFLDDAGPLMFIRNQVGCHFNLTGSEVADADVEAFGNATVALVKAMICAGCGDIPDRPDGTHFRCACKTPTKMAPLEFDK